MRIPTIILLSSVALLLLVNADNAAPPVAPIAANIAADLTIDTPSSGKALNAKPDDPAVEAPLSTLKMKEDDKTYPVGKGIVFTKTTFVVDDKDKKDSGDKFRKNGLIGDLLGGLLGIDINLGGGDKGKKKGKDGEPTETPAPGKDDDEWNKIPLYEDDKSGTSSNRGQIETLSEGPESTTTPPPPPADNKQDAVAKTKPTTDDDKITTPGPKDTPASDKVLAEAETTPPTAKDPAKKDKKAKEIDPNGLRICLLGICIGDDDDDDKDDDGKHHRIHHEQDEFLRQFRGKALKIDGKTGCPIPSS
ncbi:hypothetical protein BGX33_011858 [Mortierella sp. NVP41]|nr:hypothetical protein BGX33_011858 [Mortierella sp. NVP41]